MERSILDELTVPMPPYRMARPVVTLAAAPQQPTDEKGAKGKPSHKPFATIGDTVKKKLAEGRIKESQGTMPTVERAQDPLEQAANDLKDSADRTREALTEHGENASKDERGKQVVVETGQAISSADELFSAWSSAMTEKQEPQAPAAPEPATPAAPVASASGPEETLTAFMSDTARANYEAAKAAGRDVSPYLKGAEKERERIAWMNEMEEARAKAEAAKKAAPPAPDTVPPIPPVVEAASVIQEAQRAVSSDTAPGNTGENAAENPSPPSAVPEGAPDQAAPGTPSPVEPAPAPQTVPEITPAPDQEVEGPKVPTEEDIEKLLTERDRFQPGSPDWRRLSKAANEAAKISGVDIVAAQASADRRKLEESKNVDAGLRELSELQTEQRRLEKLSEEAKAAGNTDRQKLLLKGIIELGQQINRKRATIQGAESDAAMAEKEMDYARRTATVEDFERGKVRLAEQKVTEEKRKDEEASGKRTFELARKYALELSVKDIANRYRDRGVLSPQEWSRYKQLALEEATIQQEDKAISALTKEGRTGLKRRLLAPGDAQELAALRLRLEEAQRARAEQMHGEEEGHGEALQEQAERNIPRPDRMNMAGYLSEALRYVTERTGTPATWWETFARRMDIVESRHFALFNGMFQQRAQNKLDNANGMIREYEDKLKDAGILSKVWYGNRLRVWQKRAGALEAKVDAWNARREAFTARHTALQQEVISRYNRELAPYVEQVRDLSGRVDVQMRAMENIARHRAEALERLAQAEAAGKRGRWFMGPRARRCVNEIKAQIKDMDRRIAAAELSALKYRKQLAESQAEVDKWQLKIRTTAQHMLLPEQRGFKRATRGPEVPIRQVNAVETTVPQRVRRGAAPETAATPERDPSQLEWKLDDFVEQWNSNGLTIIEDPRAFTEYIELARRGAGQQGDPTAVQLMELLRPYIQRASVKPDMKQFDRDVRYFLTNIRPRT